MCNQWRCAEADRDPQNTWNPRKNCGSQCSTDCQLRDPLTDFQKNGTVHYVRDPTARASFGVNWFKGGVSAHAWNYHPQASIYLLKSGCPTALHTAPRPQRAVGKQRPARAERAWRRALARQQRPDRAESKQGQDDTQQSDVSACFFKV